MILSVVKLGIGKAIFTYGRELISPITFRIDCSTSAKFGTRDLKIMLFGIREVRENQRMEGLIFYGNA